jgi:hypothetical protein
MSTGKVIIDYIKGALIFALLIGVSSLMAYKAQSSMDISAFSQAIAHFISILSLMLFTPFGIAYLLNLRAKNLNK